jgi:hypothetical protein
MCSLPRQRILLRASSPATSISVSANFVSHFGNDVGMTRHTADTLDKGKVSGPETVAIAKEHNLYIYALQAS